MAKMNCWEFKKCGRQPGGAKVAELGECPAPKEKKADGCNQGKMGGRACWAIAGTLCGGKVQGSYAQKASNCMECDFYKQVKTEEGQNYIGSKELLKKLA